MSEREREYVRALAWAEEKLKAMGNPSPTELLLAMRETWLLINFDEFIRLTRAIHWKLEAERLGVELRRAQAQALRLSDALKQAKGPAEQVKGIDRVLAAEKRVDRLYDEQRRADDRYTAERFPKLKEPA